MEKPDPNPTEYLEAIGSERRLQLLVDAVKDYAIYLLDAQGIGRSWNAGAERFTGYKAEEIIGQHFSRFYTEEDRLIGLPERALRTAAAATARVLVWVTPPWTHGNSAHARETYPSRRAQRTARQVRPR